MRSLPPSVQSMLEVAKAISLKPRLLLLDEVTAALHHDEVDILFDTLKELKKEGVAIVIVTHRMEEINQGTLKERSRRFRTSASCWEMSISVQGNENNILTNSNNWEVRANGSELSGTD